MGAPHIRDVADLQQEIVGGVLVELHRLQGQVGHAQGSESVEQFEVGLDGVRFRGAPEPVLERGRGPAGIGPPREVGQGRATKRILALQPQEATHGRIALDDPLVGADQQDELVLLFEHGAKTSFAGFEFARRQDAFGGVAEHTAEHGAAAIGHVDARDAELARESTAVLANDVELPNGVEDPGLAGRRVLGEVLVVVRVMRLRHQDVHVATDQLDRVPTEDAVHRLAGRLDRALHVDRDHAVEESRQDRAHARLAACEPPGHDRAVGDVLDVGREHPVPRTRCVVANQGPAPVRLLAVAAVEPHVQGEA